MTASRLHPLLAPVLAATLAAAGCGTTPRPLLDLRDSTRPAPEATLAWVGRGEAERLEGGAWRRIPAFDYEFTVVQHRYADRWESVKTLRRLHPAYDGSAGPREQVMTFLVQPRTADGGRVGLAVRSTLGDGSGETDREFRRARIDLRGDVGRFAPFDTYRISQEYRYEEGRLAETVELLATGKGGERPWVRNREEASLFGSRRLDGPPTVAPAR